MSETLINSLNLRVSALEEEKRNLNAALSEARKEQKDAKREADSLREQVQQITAERDKLKSQFESENGKLKGELRSIQFERAFEAAAIQAGVKPSAVADLFKLSGLKAPEGDGEIKADSFAEFLDSAKESRSWAFGESNDPDPSGGSSGGAGSKESGSQERGGAKPPGSGRGESGRSAGQVKYRRSDIVTPGWQQKNPDLVKALAEGRAEMVGD